LVGAGYREIVLTGIFLGAYGRDTALRRRFARGRPPLAELVEALAQVEGLERLRLSSLEPGDVDDALLEVLASNPVCVPHLHLPLQSGSADVLRRMNRQYTRDAFVEMVERVRRSLDRPAITTDVIVAFPGETDADFEASLEVARFAEFCKIHAFPFSSRDGTAAARWRKEFVPREVVRERMTRLADVELECSLAYRLRMLGAMERVIVEPLSRPADPTPIRHGRCDRYFEVHFEASKSVKAGDLVRMRIDRVTPTRTHGTCSAARGDLPLPVLSPMT
jgi:threonylcarbamoyladenosine tRNA methylthiotransferase MtaB